MITVVEKLASHGYVIIPKDSYGVMFWGIMKIGGNRPDKWYDQYYLAHINAEELLETLERKEYKWAATMRYNRGLGIEYLNLSTVIAADPVDAKIKAEQEANVLFASKPGMEIKEIKVRPIMEA